MDYVEKAIEKDRRKQEIDGGEMEGRGNRRPVEPVQLPNTAGDAAIFTERGTNSPPPRQPQGYPPEEKSLPHPRDINYSSTKVIATSADARVRNRVIAGNINDPRVEAYRQLRSQVLGAMKHDDMQTLAVSSANENAGKTLTVVNLAIAISQEVNQTVLLVDLDLREPNVHTTLGIEVDKGIVDHLLSNEPIENILFNPGYPRLVVLPGLPQGRDASELLTSPEMKLFLQEVKDRYPDRLIVFDLPPLLRNDDAMAFMPNVDACLLVFEDGVTTPDEIQRALQLLQHTKLIGTILNKIRQF